MAFWEKAIFSLLKRKKFPSPFFTQFAYFKSTLKTLLLNCWFDANSLALSRCLWASKSWDEFCDGQCHATQGNWIEPACLRLKGSLIFVINLAMIVTFIDSCVSSQLWFGQERCSLNKIQLKFLTKSWVQLPTPFDSWTLTAGVLLFF